MSLEISCIGDSIIRSSNQVYASPCGRVQHSIPVLATPHHHPQPPIFAFGGGAGDGEGEVAGGRGAGDRGAGGTGAGGGGANNIFGYQVSFQFPPPANNDGNGRNVRQ